MSKSDAWETDILGLLFNATAVDNIADNAATAPLTDLHVSLHTADPGEAGTQDISEATYTGYARQAVVRTSAGWSVSADTVTPTADIDFPEATAGTETITHFGVGVAASGATKLLYSGTVSPNIAISAGVIPRLLSTSTITED